MCLESLLQAREVSSACHWEATHSAKVSWLIIERLARQCRVRKGTGRHTQRSSPVPLWDASVLSGGWVPAPVPKTPG